MAELFPAMTEELAELTGTILGDGCLSTYVAKTENRRRFEIAYTGHIHDEAHYLDFIQPMFMKYFGVKGNLSRRKTCNAVQFHVKSKRVFEYFNSLGIPVGEKGKVLEIPNQILDNPAFALACVRGIWDTDGSVYPRYSKKYKNHAKHYSHYAVLGLRMKSRVIMQVREILVAEGIFCNKLLLQRDGAFALRITNQEVIKKYFSLIGFRNQYHTDRLSAIKQSLDLNGFHPTCFEKGL